MSLAIARQLTGDIQAAVGEYRKVLATNPRQLDAANNLAWLLATEESAQANRDEAVELARRVCDQTNYSQPAYLDTLAVALQSQGSISEATKILIQAIPLAKGRGELELMQKMATRLKELGKSSELIK
jgi:serine/threonine-protein kinase